MVDQILVVIAHNLDLYLHLVVLSSACNSRSGEAHG
jgi:hypothetical protein